MNLQYLCLSSAYSGSFLKNMTMVAPNGLSIAAVERETGLSKDTLRVWERRYDFPFPGRDEFGERIYPPEQVEKLRLIKILMDRGHRPGKIVGVEMDELRAIVRPEGSAEAVADDAYAETEELLHFIKLCKAHRLDEMRRDLSQSLLRMGMYRFVTDVVAPLTTMVGDHWAKGDLAVFEEHLYTECVQMVMRNAISSVPAASIHAGMPMRPRILLTTVPNEPHGLGLLMSEAILTLEGASCVSLGVQTPITEIAKAVQVQSADIIALSFSASVRPAHVLESLGDLRAEVPDSTEIWVGGRSAVLVRRPPPTVRVLDLDELRDALDDWRRRNAN
ncbi:MerR family transcriptional regulator [Noviherbaspirillum sp. Root189]|uniref:MerR family transcriptional regulator n=1 Tax=Noviherbaspirillum sp. Root189 TaxID=1736487 RepID=UPI001F1EB8B9|nr:MerR family transcriptional regulator [Noviherbaspirillum sp. Root189]